MTAPMIDKNIYPRVAKIASGLETQFPYFKSTLVRQFQDFGHAWLQHFEYELQAFYGNDWDGIDKALIGYGKFALEAMKLQKKFDKTRMYDSKSYEDAATEVYQNEAYMMDMYLPGILLSHFLWNHHYRQHLFFINKFAQMVHAHGGNLFYDVGIGTGFYSKEMLMLSPRMRGEGFDLSPSSIKFTQETLTRHGVSDRYTTNRRDIISNPIAKPAPFIISIEVLEHLEDPQSFLNALAAMLEPGGLGLISAAITAPNADHIFLYNNPEEVAVQLHNAGFIVVEMIHDSAYVPRKPTDSVPRNAAFIVTR